MYKLSPLPRGNKFKNYFSMFNFNVINLKLILSELMGKIEQWQRMIQQEWFVKKWLMGGRDEWQRTP